MGKVANRSSDGAESTDRRPRDPERAAQGEGARASPADSVESMLGSVLLRPEQLEKTPPCSAACATGSDVRGWIGLIAQRRKLGLTDEEAFARAWRTIAAVNPFPATLGRICPHPCEAGCNRSGKDGAVAINALERYLGDWGLRHGLGLPVLAQGRQPESIGVVGAGPAGLSFAYQMARRGYPVTVYERDDKAGGMLQHGIPEYRLPEHVLAAEIRRILDLGVELRLGVAIGREVTIGELRDRHAALFLGIGAAKGLRLAVPGEDGAGVWTGIEYLEALNRGAAPAVGEQIVVVGGGNTAMDAARAARRSGAHVTVLYRRTSAEMPAIAAEVAAAAEEGVVFEYLAAPVRIERTEGRVRAVVALRMRLAEADASGRARCVPVEGSEFTLPADTVIVAVSQSPDWSGLEAVRPPTASDEAGADDGILAAGDVLGPGIAGFAVAQGRRAAETLHARLRGATAPEDTGSADRRPTVRPDYYASKARTVVPSRPVTERLAEPDAEMEQTIGETEFTGEAERCFSCGLCFGCEHCFTYCNPGGFTRLAEVGPGKYFALSLDRCEGCRKCVEVCPCGYLSVASEPSRFASPD